MDYAPLRKPHKDWNRRISHCPVCVEKSVDAAPEVLDCIIIGGGPAGITAAVYASRRGLSTMMITGDTGGQMRWSADVQNWTGVQHATGQELVDVFMQHIDSLDSQNGVFPLWVRRGAFVESLEKSNTIFTATLKNGEVIRSKTVTIACGKTPRTLGLTGENKARKTKTLSFSATSDAPLYTGKNVMIIGGGNSALDIALQLTHYAKSITIATNIDHLRGEECLRQKVLNHDKITVLYNTETKGLELNSEDKVKAVVMRVGENAEARTIACDGVFYAIGQTPNTQWLGDFLEKNKYGEIVVNKRCQTSVAGCFAGGDCTDQPHKQIVVAAGEGAICALECHEFVQHGSV